MTNCFKGTLGIITAAIKTYHRRRSAIPGAKIVGKIVFSVTESIDSRLPSGEFIAPNSRYFVANAFFFQNNVRMLGAEAACFHFRLCGSIYYKHRKISHTAIFSKVHTNQPRIIKSIIFKILHSPLGVTYIHKIPSFSICTEMVGLFLLQGLCQA